MPPPHRPEYAPKDSPTWFPFTIGDQIRLRIPLHSSWISIYKKEPLTISMVTMVGAVSMMSIAAMIAVIYVMGSVGMVVSMS